MDILEPLEDSNSIFMVFTKRLNQYKVHELLNKIQEFMAGLREEDLRDSNLKELTVKRNAAGKQSYVLNVELPQPQPTQVQTQPPIQIQVQPQPQAQLQPQQQVQHQLQAPLQTQAQPQVQIQAQPQPHAQVQAQPQLQIQQQQLPKVQPNQPQIQINQLQKQVPEQYYQTQPMQYEGPQLVKKVKTDQTSHNEVNNQQVAASMDNGGFNQQKYSAMKPELTKANYTEYDEYDQIKEAWRASGQQSSHGHVNMQNLSMPFRAGQTYSPMNTMSAISAMNTDIQPPRNKNIGYYQEDSNNHHTDTPKFPNQHTLAAYVEKIWKENPTLQENNDIVERDKAMNFNSKSYPVFETSFVKIDPPNFYIDAVKPGIVSKKLSQALGMGSEKEAPPYLSKLLKIGVPGTYREETFYGINAKVPKDFDKESWLKAGVSPTMFETEKMEVVLAQGNQDKSKDLPKVLSDTDYLERFLRKPQTFGKTGAPLKTIEIDD